MERKAGIRFSQTDYVALDMEAMTLTEVKNGTTTEYEIGGSTIEKKLLYTNPDTSIEMTGDTLFSESEILDYQYLIFTVTDTSNSFEVEEWCEIAPLHYHNGQFAVSLPANNELWVRKIYRSSGAVKPSAGVYAVGKTTQDKSACIIKKVECVRGVE